MDRRTFLVTVAGGLFAVPLAAKAEQTASVPKIGYLSALSQPGMGPNIETFRQGLGDLGYFEGRNIVVEYRWAHGIFIQLPDLAADLIRLNVRLIVAASNREITAAKEATTTIPIVMVNAIDPVGAGFIASIARPGGNLTGLAWAPAVEIVGKHIEFLRDVVPHLSRVAVLVDPGFPGISPYRDAAAVATKKLRLAYQEIETREADDFSKAFAVLVRERSQAVFWRSFRGRGMPTA